MNTRLLELAKKAGFHHRYDEYQDISYVTNEELFEQERHVNDKRLIEILTPFTELIIKETLEVVRDEVQYALDDYLADTIDLRVKDYFGIE